MGVKWYDASAEHAAKRLRAMYDFDQKGVVEHFRVNGVRLRMRLEKWAGMVVIRDTAPREEVYLSGRDDVLGAVRRLAGLPVADTEEAKKELG